MGEHVAKHTGKCPRCGQGLDYDKAVGERITCSGCGATLKVPAGSEAPYQPNDRTLPATPSAPSDPLVGESLGEFKVQALLNRGGMGAVYIGFQSSLGRPVAIKVLPQHLANNESFVERFHREARTAAAIRHPNIIEIFSVGEDKGYEYIAMELIEGETLADVLKRERRIMPDRALDLMKQVTSALADAHAFGILHRDIKPANILLDSKGRPKVADFGLAKQSDTDISITVTGQSLGTPLYIPPEAARGAHLDARSDIYSLGATFYHALAGHPPFQGATAMELASKHIEAEVPSLHKVAPGVPRPFCRIIHRCLCKNRDERYADACALLEALEGIDAASVAAQNTPSRKKRRPARRSIKKRPAAKRRKTSAAVTDAARDARAASPPDASRIRDHPKKHPDAKRRKKRMVLFGGGIVAGLALTLILVIILSGGTKETPPPAKGEQVVQKPSAGGQAEPWKVYTKWPFNTDEAERRQKETAKALGVPVEQDIDLGNGATLTMALIPAGSFMMGSPPDEEKEEEEEGRDDSHEGPQHKVTITKPFYMSVTEVTQAQYMFVTGKNPSKYKGANRPVEMVSWNDAVAFCKRLSATKKRIFRLPTEAEWEYACRAGTTTRFNFGDKDEDLHKYGNYADRTCTAGSYKGMKDEAHSDGHDRTAPAGSYKPNPWELYDMHGNVWEWCIDWHGDYADADAEAKDPTGPASGDRRVLRGGSWNNLPRHCRSANRYRGDPGNRQHRYGLRVVVPLSQETLHQAKKEQETQPRSTVAKEDRGSKAPSVSHREAGGATRSEWKELFDGKIFAGWKFSTENPESFKIENGMIVANGKQAHLFYAGDVCNHDFTDFELKVDVKTEPNGNGGIYFHTKYQEQGYPTKGHEAQVNNTQEDYRKTGSLYAVRDVTKSPVKDGEWFTIHIIVRGKKVVIKIDGKTAVDFTQGPDYTPPKERDGQLLSSGTFALQCHNSAGAVYYKNIRVKSLVKKADRDSAGSNASDPEAAAEAERRQNETAKALGVPVEQDIDLGNGVTMTMVLIPAGSFMMGSPPDEEGRIGDVVMGFQGKEGPQHKVTITRPFYMGKTEVTQAQYTAVTGENPSENKGADRPVEMVTWHDAAAFCKRLSKATKLTCRLPTEAKWEYACRAGTTSRFSFGDKDEDLHEYGNYADRTCTAGSYKGMKDEAHSDGHDRTAPAGSLKPNPWGLYDMHGNVFEWCADWYGNCAKEKAQDPAGPASGDDRVRRGGSWNGPPSFCRSAHRGCQVPVYQSDAHGFRVVFPLSAGAD